MKNKGFTLIELMIVMAIIGILAAIILPQFNLYNEKRAAAEAHEMQSGERDSQEITGEAR